MRAERGTRASRWAARLVLVGLAVSGGVAAAGPMSAGAAPAGDLAPWRVTTSGRTVTTATQLPPEACTQVRDGVHCFEFSAGWVRASYRSLGDEARFIRLRLGHSSLPAPGCDPLPPLASTPVVWLEPGDAIVIAHPAPEPRNWASVAVETDAGGRVIGIRGVACEYGPETD